MDDSDYLVENNPRNDFSLSSEMDGTHGRMAHWWRKLGTNANAGNDSGNWGGTPSVESESTV